MPMTEPRKLKSFLLHHGYVEDQSLAALPLHHEEGFDHPLDALESLQKALAEAWAEQNPPMGCCEKAPEGSNYCPVCGRNLYDKEARQNIAMAGAADLFIGLFGEVNDGNRETFEIFESHGWGLGFFNEPEWLTTMVGVNRWLEDEGWCEAYMPNGDSWNVRQNRDGTPAW